MWILGRVSREQQSGLKIREEWAKPAESESMRLVAGVDCSTQSTKVVVCNADTGEVLRSAAAAHPEGTEIDPSVWWHAFQQASRGLLDGVEAIAVAGQQHGMVLLDESGHVVRPALLWNDTRSGPAAVELIEELGGPDTWAEAVGSVPVASFTITKLRWTAEHEPERAKAAEQVVLPHDWLTWQLLGGPAGGHDTASDRGDASGTGYWSPAAGEYRHDILERAFGRSLRVPTVLAPSEPAGTTADGMLVAAGTGDNMGAALGLGIGPGDVVVSLGTSGTVFAVHEAPTADSTGVVAGFADATGRFLPLVCTLNAARVLDATARMLGTDHAGLDRLALDAAAGAGGLVLVPYLDGERTPNLPAASGTLAGMRRANMTPENLARAAVEGLLCGLADGLDVLREQGVEVGRVSLVGGAARSAAVRTIAPAVFAAPVSVPAPDEYVAIGAARQAAWALVEGPEPPAWPVRVEHDVDAHGDGASVREAYRQTWNQLYGEREEQQ
jgi:xylulokinase